jgi:hypothetical protein
MAAREAALRPFAVATGNLATAWIVAEALTQPIADVLYTWSGFDLYRGLLRMEAKFELDDIERRAHAPKQDKPDRAGAGGGAFGARWRR